MHRLFDKPTQDNEAYRGRVIVPGLRPISARYGMMRSASVSV